MLYHLHAGQVSGQSLGMRQGHLDRHDLYADRPWHDPRLRRRFAAVSAWDVRDRRGLARALVDPVAAAGLARMLLRRRAKRRAGRRAAAALRARGIETARG